MEYAIYKGDRFIDLGTKTELARRFGVKPSTIEFYSRPSYIKRADAKGGNHLIAIKIEDGDD